MKLDFADIKPSVINWLIVGLMAVTFIVAAKWMVSRYNVVPALSDLINAV